MIPRPAGTGLEYWLGDDMAQWVQREYGKGEIDRAGQYLIPWWTRKVKTLEKITEAYAIIENWRTSHAMPLLTFRMSLANRARRLEPNAIIAQRLKRFVAIMNKLVREPNMKLSQMHDLGGCRAIVSDMATVRRLYNLYGGDCGLFERGRFKCYDYIQNPKSDGYRGSHVVGRYEARAVTNEPWNGQRIEIQLRTQLQHAFATTVETVTTFTKQPLKFGAGPDEWRRFFSLVGSAFALLLVLLAIKMS
jgi:ppGpp synthetase/RelA/SpoT-type nucleotidyltranferase